MCLWTCKRRALLKAYYMVCDTMETVSGIIVYYLVVRKGLMHNSEIWSECWASVVSAHCEVCDDLSTNASFHITTAGFRHWQRTSPPTAEKLTQIMINEWEKDQKNTWYTLLYNHNNQAYLCFKVQWLLYIMDSVGRMKSYVHYVIRLLLWCNE